MKPAEGLSLLLSLLFVPMFLAAAPDITSKVRIREGRQVPGWEYRIFPSLSPDDINSQPDADTVFPSPDSDGTAAQPDIDTAHSPRSDRRETVKNAPTDKRPEKRVLRPREKQKRRRKHAPTMHRNRHTETTDTPPGRTVKNTRDDTVFDTAVTVPDRDLELPDITTVSTKKDHDVANNPVPRYDTVASQRADDRERSDTDMANGDRKKSKELLRGIDKKHRRRIKERENMKKKRRDRRF